MDLKHLYPGKRFVQADVRETPFKDNEFDFAIASHVLEHMSDADVFIAELQRISKRGYIEMPTPLFDNLVVGNKKYHACWVTFDDPQCQIVIRPIVKVIDGILNIRFWRFFVDNFPESAYISLYWENSIEFRFEKAEIQNK